MAVRTQGHAGRPAQDVALRRYELYVRAAPVFAAFGYRQVTMKALAHACGLSAPALYRYFPSKLDFALFPIAVPERTCHELLIRAAESHRDPLRALRAVLETAAADISYITLAMRLALEAGHDDPGTVFTRDVEKVEARFADAVLRCVPELGSRANAMAHTLLSLSVAAAATSTELAPEILWQLGAPVVRGYLVEAGIPEIRLHEVFGR